MNVFLVLLWWEEILLFDPHNTECTIGFSMFADGDKHNYYINYNNLYIANNMIVILFVRTSTLSQTKMCYIS